jgi:hypothetical protein
MASLSGMTREDCPRCGPGVLFVGFVCLHCKKPLSGSKPRGNRAAIFNGDAAAHARLEAGVQFKRQRASTPAPRKGSGHGLHGAGRA